MMPDGRDNVATCSPMEVPMTSTPETSLPVSSSAGALRPDIPVWQLFWRLLVAGIGHVLVVPSPWTTTMLYNFLVARTALPDGRRLAFTGQPGDIWPVLIAISALSWLHGASGGTGLPPVLGLLGMLVAAYLTVPVYRWLCANVKSEDGRLALTFGGDALAYVGWTVLMILSFITIIGWAWVAKFMLQWICRNVQGTQRFDFTATGWQILWRVLVFGLLNVLIIPIPWTLRWLTSWMISQVTVSEGTTSQAAAVPTAAGAV
jgi:hypothetical protein